jgi:hypothetical protein
VCVTKESVDPARRRCQRLSGLTSFKLALAKPRLVFNCPTPNSRNILHPRHIHRQSWCVREGGACSRFKWVACTSSNSHGHFVRLRSLIETFISQIIPLHVRRRVFPSVPDATLLSFPPQSIVGIKSCTVRCDENVTSSVMGRRHAPVTKAWPKSTL